MSVAIVGVLDRAINHPVALNNKVLQWVHCTNTGCNNIQITVSSGDASHGTRVAQVLAASELMIHNGTAPGTDLLSVNWTGGSSLPHAFDWLLKNGAEVVNWSGSLENDTEETILCSATPQSYDMIINEAADKGMIIVKTAGNAGWNYETISVPGCSPNIITVGGINDRTPGVTTMYASSSRGPSVLNGPVLKPDLVAPAVGIQVLRSVDNSVTRTIQGTSFAAPQVSAAAAVLLQANPGMSAAEVKAALLLGATWQGPIPCNSQQFESVNSNDRCSHAMQPSTEAAANNAAAVHILNNVGFGILNVNQTLEYASERSSSHRHVIGDHLNSDSDSKRYSFYVSDTTEPVKVILTWFVHPHGTIQEQWGSTDDVSVADLDFVIRTPSGSTITANSENQTNEFAVFNPSHRGIYTITVTGSGIGDINKPVQHYAIASTHSLSALPIFPLNRAPVAHANTVTINPNMADPAIIRLTATDADGDLVSFRVSDDPQYGDVSVAEQITKTSSRMFYNASSESFDMRDSFVVTPQDGQIAGTSATITIQQESLPTNSVETNPTSDMIRDWDTHLVTGGSEHVAYRELFAGPSYAISAIYLGSDNMEGVDASIVTSTNNEYTVAVPPSGVRMIELAAPVTIRSITLAADGLDEEAAHTNSQVQDGASEPAYDDVRMFAGYVPAACAAAGADSLAISGAQGAGASSCPAHVTYDVSSRPALVIADNTQKQDSTDTIPVPVNGTLKSVSVSVDISHTYTGDLRVDLSSPSGKTVTLHSREGGGSDDIKKTYDSSTFTALGALHDTDIAGNWTLSIGDYARGDVGTLNSWSLSTQYKPSPTTDTTQDGNTVTVFSDDFESGTLAKWTETGDGDWTITTSQAQAVPTIPGYQRDNMVLHADDCDSTCTVTTKQAIDLSDYKSATLSFWRFVDRSLDSSEYLKVEVSDGSSWSTILHWSDNNNSDDSTWHKETYDLAKYVGKSSVSIRFVTQQSYTNEDVQVDDVVISANKSGTIISPPPPPPPTNAYSVYVADTDDYEILAYTPEGSYINDIVPRKSGGLGKPFDAAFGPDGHLYVSDISYEKIRKYNGNTGAPLGTTSGNAEWVSAASSPSGLFWNGNTLYVATLKGIERISLSGSSLGLFGDASRTPTTSGAPKLASPYDVAFCPDGNMYVADRALDSILYYDGSTGKYKGTVPSAQQSTQKPDTDNAVGLKCSPAIAGTSGTTNLFQSGGDPGRINEVNPTTRLLVRQFTSLIDEPYGIDSDASGNLYVANKDDNNIVKISSAGVSSVFATGGLDDPRGVAIGPKHTAPSSSSSDDDSQVPHTQHNDGPRITLQSGTQDITFRIELAQNTTATYTITAADPENDPIAFILDPYAVESGTILFTDHHNATATISLNTTGMDAGTYAFEVAASDGHNIERAVYAVVVH